MKKLTFAYLIVVSFILASCNNPKKNSTENNEISTEDSTAIGGQQDEHGCLTAAGYTWSTLKEECIRIFESGERLNPVEQQNDQAIISAFVVFNADKSKVELFLPTDSGKTTILDRSEDNLYLNNAYKFDSKESILYINDVKSYQAE